MLTGRAEQAFIPPNGASGTDDTPGPLAPPGTKDAETAPQPPATNNARLGVLAARFASSPRSRNVLTCEQLPTAAGRLS